MNLAGFTKNVDEDTFIISYSTEYDFSIVLYGHVDDLNDAESIFLNMMTNLHTGSYKPERKKQ